MEIFTYIGMLAVAIGCFGIAIILYSFARALFLAHDFTMWQYTMAKESDRDTKFEFKKYFRCIAKNWVDMIGYTSDSFTCQIGQSEWSGYGSWKK